MTDYMLTVTGGSLGSRDIQVNNAGGIREAIEAAEKVTGCRVDHGRGGIGSNFDPGIVIDLESGEVTELHDREALTSLQVVGGPPQAVAAVRAVLAKGKARATS